MRIDLVSGEKWERSRDEAKKILGSTNQVWVHRGLASALYEVLESLRSLFAHKKSISGMKGLSGAYEFIWPQYLREMYTVQNANWQDFLTPEKLSSFLDNLKKDTIFFVWSEDHPVTGQKLPLSVIQELEKQLNERKIFSVRVSHAAHFQLQKDTEASVLPSFSILIRSINQNLAVVEAGVRFKSTLLVSGNSEWSASETGQALFQSFTQNLCDAAMVQKFESLYPGQCFFAADVVDRIFDRAVLVFEDINADLLANMINKKMGFDSEDLLVRTTSLCALDEGIRLFSAWWNPLPSNEQLRGMILFDQRILSKPNLKSCVDSSLSEIRQLQSGQ